MQDDQFFANYGGDTLLVSGVVGSITTESGDTTVEFVTSIPTKVRCDLGAATTAKVGDAITVRSDAGERHHYLYGNDNVPSSASRIFASDT